MMLRVMLRVVVRVVVRLMGMLLVPTADGDDDDDDDDTVPDGGLLLAGCQGLGANPQTVSDVLGCRDITCAVPTPPIQYSPTRGHDMQQRFR
jgi:hypothetical protein